MKWTLYAALMAVMTVAAPPASAQTLATRDAVIERIWRLGMDSSQAYPLAQTLLDSLGPRLTGTPGMEAAQNWVVGKYRQWGIPARNERYGTWRGWRRGPTHVDLIRPRVRTLEGTMLAWSPGTPGTVEGPVIVLPQVGNPAEFQAWLPEVRGKFIAIDFAQPTCRPDRQWEEFSAPANGPGSNALDSFGRMRREREAAQRAWRDRVERTGLNPAQLRLRLEEVGAAGILQSNWSLDYGVQKVFGTNTRQIPTLDLSCEDYGLVFRLAENNQGPAIRVNAQADVLGEVPVANTIAEIRGTELPNEYVMLSAHFDSWESSSGATDNGTGTLTMLEAMRILKLAYPNPQRTILVGHWSGEEQGLNGSRAFAKDHPEIVAGLQALFNQDNGTGRVVSISMQGLVNAGEHFGRWLARVPSEITQHIELTVPGSPGGGGSDYASFICAGAPAFSLSALNWGYGTYTWHTNRDTFDKIVFDDLQNNATLTAMLVYLASEDPERVSRARREIMPRNPVNGQEATWPECRDAARSSGGE